MTTSVSESFFLAEPRPVSFDDVVISHELTVRRMPKIEMRAEIAALHGLAGLFTRGWPMVLNLFPGKLCPGRLREKFR